MTQKFALRLAVEDGQKANSAMREFGQAGAGSFKAIGDASERATTKARAMRNEVVQSTPVLRAVDHAAKDLRSTFDGLAGRIPVVGGALKAMGPGGLAAAAGIAAAALAVGALYRETKKAIAEADRITTAAANAGISAQTYQALEAAGIENDVENLAGSMMTLEKNASEAAGSTGKLYSKLKDLHPEVLKQIASAKTQEERWDAIAKAISETSDRTEKIQIATAAFGKEGATLVRILESEGGSMDQLVARYKEMGLIIDESLLNRADAAGDRMDLVSRKIQVSMTNAFIAFIPYIETALNWLSGVVDKLAEAADRAKDLADISPISLRNRIKDAERERDILNKQSELSKEPVTSKWDSAMLTGKFPGKGRPELDTNTKAAILRGRLKPGEYYDRMREVQSNLYDLYAEQKRRDAEVYSPTSSGATDDPAGDKSAAAERARMEKMAAQIRGELGDKTLLLKQHEEELAPLVKAGLLTQQQVNAEMERYRKSLQDVSEAQQEWTQLVEASRTPVQKIKKQIDQLWNDFADAAVSSDTFAAALKALNENLADAEQKAYLASDAAKAYAENLKKTQEQTLATQGAMSVLDAAVDEQINSWQDLERVALNVLFNIAKEALLTQAKVGGSGQSFGQLIMGAIGGIFGRSPGSPGYVDPSQAAYPDMFKHHSGYAPESNVYSLAAFRRAPRFHSGFGPHEMPAIIDDRERIFSAAHNERIVRALEGGRGNVTVNVVNETGGQVEQTERRTGDGGRQIEIRIRRSAAAGMAAGDFDESMRRRYGVTPLVARRG